MAENKLPGVVPLPAVPRYTDEIEFGNLALPHGFDEERLLVNIGAFNRVRAAAGLGSIMIYVASGKSLDYIPNVSSIDNTGTATVGAAARQQRRQLANGSVRYNDWDTLYGHPDATVKINGNALDTTIQESYSNKKPAILRDPKPRAKALDKAIHKGLYRASREANFDRHKALMSVTGYPLLFGISMALNMGNAEQSLVTTAVVNPAVIWGLALYEHKKNKEGKELSRLRKSLFAGCTPDRFAMGAAVIRTSRFIKAAK